MTAALGPVEEMVSKDRPAKLCLVLMRFLSDGTFFDLQNQDLRPY